MLVGDICNSMRRIVTVIALAIALLGNAQAFRGGEIFRIRDSDILWAAVKTEYFVESMARQEEDHWCWAACIRMIMKGYGERQSQSDIVGLVYGYSYDWTATGNDIARAFDGWNGWRAKTFKQKSAQILIDELVSHGPIMIGTEEHAYLLTHIYYTESRTGEASPFKAILINPTTAREEVRDWTDLFPAINTIVALFKE